MDHLSNEQILALLAAARAASEMHWLMILVGFWHGLRASEVVGLTASCIADGQITVQRLKGSLKTSQDVVDDTNPLLNCRAALFDFVRGMHPNQRVFPVSRVHFWRLVQKYGLAAGIPKRLAHPHILKHSIAMQSIPTAGIENVRQHLGHKNLSSTGAYLKVSDRKAMSAVVGAVKAATHE